jgi:formate--tetrahydrofolate ligase
LEVLRDVKTPAPRFTYELTAPFTDKVHAIATQVYGAREVILKAEAHRDLERLHSWGLSKLPVCMAKTHLSLSDDPKRRGAPSDFAITIRHVRPSAGAGFLTALTGEIMTMPGLPKEPASRSLDVTADGEVVGLR